MIYRHRPARRRRAPERSRAKYRKGMQVPSLLAAVRAIEDGQNLYLGDKVQNPAWMMNMSLVNLQFFVRRGDCHYAEKVQSEEDDLPISLKKES